MLLSPKDERYPRVREAEKAIKTLKIVKKQPFPFNSNEIWHVFNAISSEERVTLRYIYLFMYGYIEGVRAERKRRKARK